MGHVWHKVVPFSVVSAFSYCGDNEPIFPMSTGPNDYRIYPTGDSELSILVVRTGFEFLAQRVDGLRPKKPKTMNL